ncbi:pentapeptide repeat-containing protein [Aerosakkonema sp. BLCC-F183]|uniref:pentapeptide repeat-containing protein n=1 Tax=Aerosakkonema sp. BLCC-F183 TaxID=3342834 RepID=UPI0035BB955B
MSNFPDFSSHGYQIERELGHNRACGRVTYLAIDTKTHLPVVIKQFQFAQFNASWSDYDSVNREIQMLRQLNHPSIPRYLDSFQTTAGFCLVQEYKQAPSLAQSRLFNVEEIKQIAAAVLEVLIYLQQQIPSVIHRDIKPENILVDRTYDRDRLSIYLVDFGFARSGSGEVALSSAVKGTLGFMPPEQLFNRQLTEASDLYSLGATLVCLLTNTKSTEIGNLIDENYTINFKHLLPNLSQPFIKWLEKMVAPNLKNRFANAAAALESLRPIDVVRNNTTASLASAGKPSRGKTSIHLTMFACFLGLFSTSLLIFTLSNHKKLAIPQDGFRQLLVTNECFRCELTGADLKQINLSNAKLAYAKLDGANLTGANLRYAYLEGANLGDAKLAYANLGGAKLSYANLGGANLIGAKLSYANLEGANLLGAKLMGGKLGYANLVSTNLSNADLTGAYLWRAKLGYSYLNNANLERANLEGAQLNDSKLEGADLAAADLSDANLERADLRGADLEGANLEGAILEETKLWGAYLEGANLANADLNNADLRAANLSGANLSGAYLRGANLRGANLIGANLQDAYLADANLKGATMPDGSVHK